MSTWPIPDGLDAARAACVPVAFGTAQECLFTAANLEAGQTALIQAGAGGVGMAAIQLAKQAGATVLSTASSDEKLERLKELGLDHGINYATDNFVERTQELTDSRGADVVIDSIGAQNLVDGVEALAYRGTLVSVGVAARAGSSLEIQSLWAKNNTVRGVYLGGAMLPEYARIHPMIGGLIERVAAGELRVEIDRTFPLAEAAAAHAYVESRKAFGRGVITPWSLAPDKRFGMRAAALGWGARRFWRLGWCPGGGAGRGECVGGCGGRACRGCRRGSPRRSRSAGLGGL